MDNQIFVHLYMIFRDISFGSSSNTVPSLFSMNPNISFFSSNLIPSDPSLLIFLSYPMLLYVRSISYLLFGPEYI